MHKVPAAYSTWGVIQTRAWLAVDKKAAAALKSKSGPSANRANDLVRRYQEINTADIDVLNKVARNIKEGQDATKMIARHASGPKPVRAGYYGG